jgi:hypothetical protein
VEVLGAHCFSGCLSLISVIVEAGFRHMEIEGSALERSPQARIILQTAGDTSQLDS